ncbi:hypothetical protein O181_018608 [Austropuccinia psidii MF-1]|uniref:Uncharacterized protein n=1 Tax=Austropuccinia psidii MF-1 TaxID=1389203 RepID=A0A9Q3C863_9BASI|nr:hypothetical protein [Austropuccinia psidii MF-1]
MLTLVWYPQSPPSSLLALPHPCLSQSICSEAPSRYTSYTALNPCYASSSLPITILMLSQFPPDMPLMLLPHQPNPQHHLPSLRSCNTLNMRLQFSPISALTTASSSLPLTILTLPQRPQDMPLMPPLTPLTPNSFSAAYHPYAQV